MDYKTRAEECAEQNAILTSQIDSFVRSFYPDVINWRRQDGTVLVGYTNRTPESLPVESILAGARNMRRSGPVSI